MIIFIENQQKIFLVYRALFEEQNAHVRQFKTIRKILIFSKKSSSLLILSFELDKVIFVFKRFLEKSIFSSKLKIKFAFSVFYEIFSEQDARHETSNANAAREKAKTLQEIEILNNVVIKKVDAEIFKFENVNLNKKRKLFAAIESLECFVSDNQD